MNKLLMKHKPVDVDKDKWEETWKNGAYYVTPLVKVLLELRGKDTITEKELEHPNLKEMMIWDASKRRIIDQIIDIIGIPLDNIK